jgi:hypothetical protein
MRNDESENGVTGNAHPNVVNLREAVTFRLVIDEEGGRFNE